MLIDQLNKYLQAGFSAILINSNEPFEVQQQVLGWVQDKEIEVASWNIAQGINLPKQFPDTNNPIAPLQHYPSTDSDNMRVMILHNYHRFLESPVVVQHLVNAIQVGKSCQIFYLIISPVINLPIELERLFVVIDHQLPDLKQLLSIATDLKPEEINEESIHAAQGLTAYEAEGAFALSLIENDFKLVPQSIWSIKSSLLKKKKALSIYRGEETFNSIRGLDSLKYFSKRLLSSKSKEAAKGIVVLGPSGVGKSAFCKCLGTETNRPVIIFDIGALYDKHVGETEQQLRDCLKTIDSFGPNITMLDELEKALAGLNSDGDSGVSSRLYGTLLTWLNDRPSNSFVVATSNDISKIPETFTRAERFDATFFIDLPTKEERESIWSLYTRERNLPSDEGWTGSEIKSCCRLADLLDISLVEASEYIVPVSVSAASKITNLQDWAVDKCLSASYKGIYKKKTSEPIRRKLVKNG